MRFPTAGFFLMGIAALSIMLPQGQAQSLRVTLLGTGSPQPRMDRFGPSTLVEAGEEKLLFDAGRGAAQRLFQIQVPFRSVTALFLTHLHSDHVVGIPDFWLSGWIYGRNSPLRIWGPAGTRDMMAYLEKAFEFDIRIRRDVEKTTPPEGVPLVTTETGEGIVYERNGVKVTAFLVDHAQVKPAFGYRIDYAGRSVVLSGDTRYSENLIRSAAGADVVIHEVASTEVFLATRGRALTPEQLQAILDHHLTPEQAGEVFTRVKPKLAVYSHIVPASATAEHLIAPTRRTYSGPLEVGEDLMVIEVGETVQVRRPSTR